MDGAGVRKQPECSSLKVRIELPACLRFQGCVSNIGAQLPDALGTV
jgi:hypothetical protein